MNANYGNLRRTCWRVQGEIMRGVLYQCLPLPPRGIKHWDCVHLTVLIKEWWNRWLESGWQCISEFKEINRVCGSWSLWQRRHKTLLTYNFITYPQEQPVREPISTFFCQQASCVFTAQAVPESVCVCVLIDKVGFKLFCSQSKWCSQRNSLTPLFRLVRCQVWFSERQDLREETIFSQDSYLLLKHHFCYIK